MSIQEEKTFARGGGASAAISLKQNMPNNIHINHNTIQNNHSSNNHTNVILSPSKRNNVDAESELFTTEYLARLSPRSVEACRQLGVLTDELIVRPLEAFGGHGVPRQVAELRRKEYEHTREETLAMVRAQRRLLIATNWDPKHSPPGQKLKVQQMTLKNLLSTNQPPNVDELISAVTANPTERSTTRILPTVAEEKNRVLALEKDRLDKMVKRQQKEMEAMLAYEIRMAEMLAKQDKKLQSRQEKEKAESEQRKEEQYKLAEKRRLIELQKLQEEEKLKEQAQALAEKLYEEEQKRLKEQAEEDERRKKEARRRHEALRQKKMQREQQAYQAMERQYAEMKRKQQILDDRDQRRRDLLNQKKHEIAAEHSQKTQKAMERVHNALETNNKLLEERRQQLSEKMQSMEARLNQFDSIKKELQHEKVEQIKEKDEKRDNVLKEAQSQEERRRQQIIERRQQHEVKKQEIEKKAGEHRFITAEMRRINQWKKSQNVERLKRMYEYKRSALVEKLNDDAHRTEELEKQRHALLLARQRNAIEMMKQKKNLMKMFEKIQTSHSWEKIAETLQLNDQSGNGNSGLLSMLSTINGSPSRSHSTGNHQE